MITGNTFQCATTGKLTSQKDNDQIFLVRQD